MMTAPDSVELYFSTYIARGAKLDQAHEPRHTGCMIFFAIVVYVFEREPL